ncbi:MAG TPA: Ig-like domain-containing protein [Gemmatimonadales bacterium]|nr:Ig-like domain-containing protein [Gemmatimonadales bacterium]
MTNSKRLLCRGMLALLAGVGGCSDSTDPGRGSEGPSAVLVSDPFTASVSEAPGAHLVLPVTYVSFPPGTIPGGVSATISNPRTQAALRVELVAGGMDPVPVAADAGDTLTFVIDTGSVELMRFTRLVPASVALRVVRTEPPAGARDLPLNLRVRIVFTEPVDPSTGGANAIGLVQGGTAVPGQVTISSDGLVAIVQPDATLQPNTEYTLEVGEGVRDTDGQPLQDAVVARFTTGTASGDAVALRFDRNPVSTFVGAVNPTRVRVSAVDVLGNPATGFTGVVTLSLGANPGGGVLAGETTRTGAPYVEFDDLRIDEPGTGYTLVASSEGLTSSTSAAFDIVTEPDLIAFTSIDEGIVAVSAANGAHRVVVSDGFVNWSRAPDWAPDGRRLALRRNGTIHVVNADGSGLTSLGVPGDEPSWSPDGTMIAFVVNEDEDYNIFRMRADGSDVVRLTSSPQEDHYPDWSPDGTSILFTRRARTVPTLQAEIMLMNPDGSGVRALGRQGVNPAWSPDGSRIAFSGMSPNRMDVYVMNADGSDVTNLTVGHGEVVSYYPTWSPDGRRIAYMSSVYDEWVPYSLYVMDADGSDVRLMYPASLDINVTGFLPAVLEPAWRP